MAALVCEGAPRDLGRDQALGVPDALRDALGGSGRRWRLRDRLGPGDPRLARWQRDVRRFFPHQHEWLEGAARAAGVPTRGLLRAAVAVLERERDALLVAVEGGGGPVLVRSAAAGAVVRRVRPEGRLASLELASPLLACPWIGVNEAGLALAAGGGSRPGRDVVHAALLARDCLERFEGVESALAWCLGRPAAPGACILLADARGEVAGLELSEAGRRVRRPEAGVLVLGGARRRELAKALSGATSGDLQAALSRSLGEPDAAAAVRVEVAARRLRPRAGAEPEDLEPPPGPGS